MRDNDPFNEQKLNKFQLAFYLLPVVGWMPAVVALYNKQASKEQKAVARLSISLTSIWAIAYFSLSLGALQTTEFLMLRLLYLNGLLTTGYILTSLVMMLRLWQGKTVRLPGISADTARLRLEKTAASNIVEEIEENSDRHE
jgi:cellulose synthase/poly-beta-1,6-N-acetylglucosamine synthase-like glycosyltransferase